MPSSPRSVGAPPRAPLLAFAVAATAIAAFAETAPAPTIVPAELFTVPDGLEVTVWAQSPQLRNPTNIDIDAAGRIWVAEGVNYRRNKTRSSEGDRIVVLQDTDGDGRADSSHVFVQEPWLVAPLGIAVIDNLVVVSNAPDLIVYTDVDRNLRFDPAIDRRDVLLTGFNGANHDHSLHSVTVGPDGLWYFSQGNSGALFTDRSGRTFRIGSHYDPLRSGATPIYGWTPPQISGARSDDGHVYLGGFTVRMRPDATNVEIIGHNYRNSYEQTVTSFGDVFQNDNDDPPACRTSFVLEYGNFGFTSRDGLRAWGADVRPGQTTAVAEWRQEDPGVVPAGDVYGGGSPTGIVYYEGDALGAKWRGLLLSAEAARNTIFGYLPKPQGAGYVLERFDFFTSNLARNFAGVDFKGGGRGTELETLFRPSDVAVGPDGAIYVADWFDPRVGGHQDLDETTSGTIYRIAPRGFRSAPPKFDLATTEGRIAALRSPAVNVRAVGASRLAETGDAAVPAVAALLGDANPYVRARAIALLARLGPLGRSRVEALLSDADAKSRVAAYRALRRVGADVFAHAGRLAADPSAAVRREVALSLRDAPLAVAREPLLTLAAGYDGSDRSYLEAWGIGCTGKEAAIAATLWERRPAEPAARWPDSFAGLLWRLTPVGAETAFAERALAAELPEPARTAAVTALGFIDTPAAATALLGIAERGAGLAREQALWWLLNYKSSRWRSSGLDAALKARGLYDPDSIVLAPSIVPEPDPASALSVERILALAGDATRGAAKIGACHLCHRLGDDGVDYGPDLTGWAGRQTAEVAVRAIVNPSDDIAHGYEGVAVTTRDGIEIHGITIAGGDPLIVKSMGGVRQMIPAARIEKRARMNRSVMLSAGQLGLTEQDVADLVAYLKTR